MARARCAADRVAFRYTYRGTTREGRSLGGCGRGTSLYVRTPGFAGPLPWLLRVVGVWVRDTAPSTARQDSNGDSDDCLFSASQPAERKSAIRLRATGTAMPFTRCSIALLPVRSTRAMACRATHQDR